MNTPSITTHQLLKETFFAGDLNKLARDKNWDKVFDLASGRLTPPQKIEIKHGKLNEIELDLANQSQRITGEFLARFSKQLLSMDPNNIDSNNIENSMRDAAQSLHRDLAKQWGNPEPNLDEFTPSKKWDLNVTAA